MVRSVLTDGNGNGIDAAVESDALCVLPINAPPENDNVSLRPFRQFMTDDGTASGSSDMKALTGTSAAPISFFVNSANDSDRYITSLSFEISDAGSVLNKFGNISALSNGCKLFYEDRKLGDVIVNNSLKSNYDFVRLCQGNPSFGDAAGSFRASNVVSTSEAYIPILDFRQVFGLPWGVKIPKDSTVKINLEVRDDVTAIDSFNVIAYGFDRLKD